MMIYIATNFPMLINFVVRVTSLHLKFMPMKLQLSQIIYLHLYYFRIDSFSLSQW